MSRIIVALGCMLSYFCLVETVTAQGCPSCAYPVSCQSVCQATSGEPANPCVYPGNGCPPGKDRNGQCCCEHTPILIDVDKSGLRLTNAEGGVSFAIGARPMPVQVAWTTPGSTNGWLVLDRNNNGTIDSGLELFGSASPQPAPPAGTVKNGFLALAQFDELVNGGNADGVIDDRDAVFSRLKIWQDPNHDGVSQPGELRSVSFFGIERFYLDYHDSKRVDENGNEFRYRAKIDARPGSHVGRWAWDVILRTLAPPPAPSGDTTR